MSRWGETRLDRVATVSARIGWKALTADEYQEEGVAFLSTPNIKGKNIDFKNVNYISQFRYEESPELKLKVGDVLLAKDGNTLGITNVVTELPRPATVNGSIAVLRPFNIDGRFLRYQLDSAQIQGRIQAFKDGMGVPPLFQRDINRFPLVAPPLAEQRAVADYLDAETSRIEALIVRKQQLIHLLGERWEQYVRCELGASGRPVPLKRGWMVLDCMHRTPAYQPSGYPVVSPGDATPGRLDLSRCHRFVAEEDFVDLTGGGRRPHRGDVIYSRNASIGIASYVDSDEPFCMGQDVCLITSKVNDCLFLSYALNSLGVDQLEELKLGSTFSRVNISQILELEIPLPPPGRQRDIAAAIDDHKRRHDRALGAIAEQIALLAEHRQALITAAVTGRFNVPAAF